MFCAEPSPDTAENVANSISSALDVSITQPEANLTAEGRLEFAKALATSIESLSKRSQGLQLFRDASYQLCQALLNKAIDREQYQNLYSNLLGASIDLISFELKLTQGVISGSTLRATLPIATTQGTSGGANNPVPKTESPSE